MTKHTPILARGLPEVVQNPSLNDFGRRRSHALLQSGPKVGIQLSIDVGVNLEFVRCEDKPFEAGIALAARLGYKYAEPMVHNGRELLSEAGYFHSFSMDNEPLEMKDILDRYDVRASGLSAHIPLMRPEISVPYLEKAIRFAAVVGAPVVNTDEGIRPSWLNDGECFQVMRYTLRKVVQVAERYGIYVGIEPHQSLSKTTAGLLEIATLVDSPFLRINYDTGNAYLGGEDPYEGLKAVLPRLAHVHAKDISIGQAETECGKVTGTPVGCACGEGVIDWARVISILQDADWSGVLSVECGTPQQAAASLAHLSGILAAQTCAAALK
jgi:sugar phosphate isomerase/epimerase